jgi:hypothetical protein
MRAEDAERAMRRGGPDWEMASIRKPCHVVKRWFVLEIRLGPISGNALRSHLATCPIG